MSSPHQRCLVQPEEGCRVLPQGWTELVALIDGHPEDDPMSRLKRLCGLSVEVTGVTGAAISLTSVSARSTVCTTDAVSDELEELQDTLGEGPAVDASRDARTVRVPDLGDVDTRWPGFVPAATDLGVKAVFVLPLGMGAMRLGTLAMYRTTPGTLSEEQLKDARTLVEAASVLLTMDPPGEEPAAAFVWVLGDESRFRPEVHQAVGATMVHLGVDPREAFARLCAYAYSSEMSMAVVAGEIMARRLRLERD
jgi:GAF domain-containing protein